MIFSNIPFEIPNKFAAGVATGDIRRIGAMLHDAGTGRIVAHVQETGALNALISNAGRLSPLGMLNSTSGIYGIVQNEQIKSRLDIMQGMMGSLQTLQLATLVSSIVGIGVTVASTAMILNRLRGLKTDLATIEEKVDRIPTDLRLNTLIDILVGIETHLERLDEASLRQDSSPVLRSAEEEMPLCFNRGIIYLSDRKLN